MNAAIGSAYFIAGYLAVWLGIIGPIVGNIALGVLLSPWLLVAGVPAGIALFGVCMWAADFLMGKSLEVD